MSKQGRELDLLYLVPNGDFFLEGMESIFTRVTKFKFLNIII